jgi:hypothetical protein
LDGNNFTNLIGFPEFESEEFAKNCSILFNKNPLTSLEGCPKYANGLYVNETKLNTLEGCPILTGRILGWSRTKEMQKYKKLKTV